MRPSADGELQPEIVVQRLEVNLEAYIYGEFGVRLEDHFHITADGPRWFTQPCHSIDDPFGYEVGAAR